MAEKPRAIVEDGFDTPYIVPPVVTDSGTGIDVTADSGDTSGTAESETRDTKFEHPVERIAGFQTISPFDIGGTDNGGYQRLRPDGADSGSPQPGRRRGRPARSKNRPREEAGNPKNLIADLESLLLSVHFMGAKLLDTPEIELDESEAKKLSDSLKNVAKYYSVSLDPKKFALAELVFAVGAIYGPRGIAIYKRVNSAPKPTPATVRNIDQPPATPGMFTNGTPPVSFRPEVPSQMWVGGESDDIEL